MCTYVGNGGILSLCYDFLNCANLGMKLRKLATASQLSEH